MIPGITAGALAAAGDPVGPSGAIAGTITVTAQQDGLPSFFNGRGYDRDGTVFPSSVLVTNTTGRTFNLLAINLYTSGINIDKANGSGTIEFLGTTEFDATDFTNAELTLGTVTLCVIDSASATFETEDLGGGVWLSRWIFSEAALGLDEIPVPDDYTLIFT